MHPEFAPWRDQTVHCEKLQYPFPWHLFTIFREFRAPKLVELQLPPEFATQPAIAILARVFQLHLAQLHLDAVSFRGIDLKVVWKKAHGREALVLLVIYLKRFLPGRFLIVVEFTKIQNAPLRCFAAGQPPALLDAEVPVLLAILFSLVRSQEHFCWQNAMVLPPRKEGRSALQAFLRLAVLKRNYLWDFGDQSLSFLGANWVELRKIG